MTDEPRAVFRALPENRFPFGIWFVDQDTGELLEHIRVDGPGATEIPSYAPRPIDVVITWPDGSVDIEDGSE